MFLANLRDRFNEINSCLFSNMKIFDANYLIVLFAELKLNELKFVISYSP